MAEILKFKPAGTELSPELAAAAAHGINQLKRRPVGADSHGRLTTGAYNMPIHYHRGRAHFEAGEHVDELRSKRRYTANAIQLRCDALGLAIYLGGVTQLNEMTGQVHVSGIRVVAYDFRKMTPTRHVIVAGAEQVVRMVHHLFLATYNRLSRDYNLTGLRPEDLVLVSDNALIPDVPLFTEQSEGAC